MTTTRIDARFAALAREGRAGLVTFVSAGDPDPETSLALVRALPAAGADVIELGMPFSDPMSDGPTIQASSQRALKHGQTLAGTLALVLVTVAISYFSIVLGELTAKRLAMQRAETFALTLGPLVNVIATITRPVIWFLGFSTNIAVRLLGGDPKASREEVTDEELRAMVSSSATLGDEERQIVDEVFAAGQVTLREAMIPRTEVDFLDGDMPAHKAIRQVAEWILGTGDDLKMKVEK